MSSPPWMPLYIADYLADTGSLTTLEHGAYMLLIMNYWRHGKLPEDDNSLALIARMSPREWAKAKPKIQAFFYDGWRHKRIEIELEKSARKSEARAEFGSRGGKANALKYNKKTVAKATVLLQQNGKQNDDFALASSSQSHTEGTSKALGNTPSNPTEIRSVRKKLTDPEFEEFWTSYPRRDGSNPKQPARQKLERIVASGTPIADVVAGARAYAARIARTSEDRRFVAQAVTWLNQSRWKDEAPATGGNVVPITQPPQFTVVRPSDPNFEILAAAYWQQCRKRPVVSGRINDHAVFPTEWLTQNKDAILSRAVENLNDQQERMQL